MSNLLDQLNSQQRDAVKETEGPLLILAGAGSGKTRVITYRIAYLIQSRQVPPENILAVTFTNKAADQMKERVERLLSGQIELRPGAPHVSTFHSFCGGVLRRHIERLGYSRGFTIYDEDDQLRTVKACMGELGLSEPADSPRSTLAKISYTKNRGCSPLELNRQAADSETQKLASIYELYENKLRDANALDFDDLLLKTVELFYHFSEVCESYNQRFRYIQVDEFQDTNRIQYQLIRQLTLLQQNLCVVGDEDQSIYRWRGADIENILNFEKDYPTAKVYRLEQNYRSTQLILDAAGAVVSRNLARKGKTLWSDRSHGEKLRLFEARSAAEEAEFVAGEVASGVAAGEGSVAVLYRTNAQSRVLEESFRLRGINYRLVGGFSFYARAEIKDALAYARLANNLRDDAAFGRIVNMPPRGIGATTLQALAESARQSRLTLWEALEHELFEKRLPARALRALEAFRAIMKQLVEDRQQLRLDDFFQNILDSTGYLEILKEENQPGSQDRIDNLRELVNAAAEAEAKGLRLAEFLDHASLVSEADDYDERARVSLMTLHSAKGLEFETVFLVGMEEGVFPHRFCITDEAAIEEERRLCYVGMTRAKNRLILSLARQRRSFARESSDEAATPSRFLGEIPRELLEPLSPAGLSLRPRTEWNNAVNSVSGVERFLRERGVLGTAAGPAAHSTATSLWRIGSKVRHAKFGVGTILGAEGEGEDTKLTVSFPGYGQKKFMTKYAGLEKA